MSNRTIIDNTGGDPKADRGFAVAAILQAIPLRLWTSLLLLIGVFTLLASMLNYKQIPTFINGVLTWIQYALVVLILYFGVRILYKGAQGYHALVLQYNERKVSHANSQKQLLMLEKYELQNQQLAVKVELERQLPLIVRYALEQGHNIEYTKDGLKVANYLSNVHSLSSTEGRTLLQTPCPDFIPEPYTMSSVLQNWQPSKDGILLAKGRNLITVPAGEPMCHTVFTGNTDSGKTNNERALLIQLLFIGACCFLCDRNYQLYRQDRKTGTIYDYSLIEAQLAYPAIDNSRQALALLEYLMSELDSRRIQRRKAIVKFEDIYLFMDELPAFCHEQPTIMEYVGRLVREARQYGIFFIGAAQDLLNATLKNDNGAIRDNLLTNYYGGGDFTTAKLVLNLQKGQTIDESGLGKSGVVYLRAKGIELERMKVRTALSDNEATMMLLADRKPRQPMPEIASLLEQSPTTEPVLTADMQRVLDAYEDLLEGGENPTCRRLEEVTGFGKDKCNMLIHQLEEHGYIER
jgi:hypothetical protein